MKILLDVDNPNIWESYKREQAIIRKQIIERWNKLSGVFNTDDKEKTECVEDLYGSIARKNNC